MTTAAMIGDESRDRAAMRALIVEALKIADDRDDYLIAALLAGCLDVFDRREAED